MASAEQNSETIRAFCGAWSRRDPVEIAAYFTEDAVYHNIPMQPAHGRKAITAFIAQFLTDATFAEFELLHITATADTVMTERVDRFTTGGRSVELPVAGVFELRDGKIAAWRDYFDLQTWVRQARG